MLFSLSLPIILYIMIFFSVKFIMFASLELLHSILFFCSAFCRFSFLSLYFCFFSTSTKHNFFFISFPINLKGEIYFCRNFPSKAFESPSLDVTLPHVLPLSFSSSPWTTFSSPFSFTAIHREHLTFWNVVLN